MVEADADRKNRIFREFKQRSDSEKEELLKGKDKINTQKSTDGAIRQFCDYLHKKNLPELSQLTTDNLPDILFDFYPSAKPIKGDNYAVQTLKCLRASLNRYFRKEKGFDITQDSPFVRANEMFKAVLVESKKTGHGVRRSTPTISQIDLERISENFSGEWRTHLTGK